MRRVLLAAPLAAFLSLPALADDPPDVRAAMAQPAPMAKAGAPLPPFVLQGLRCHRNAEATDGDSIIIPRSGGNVASSRARVRGGDTPERNGRCPEERALAEVAREAMQRELKPCVYTLSDGSVDNFGRDLVWAFNSRGEEIMQKLIRAKPQLAHPYDGSGPRGGWCPEPPQQKR